jgi:hypothetical protein
MVFVNRGYVPQNVAQFGGGGMNANLMSLNPLMLGQMQMQMLAMSGGAGAGGINAIPGLQYASPASTLGMWQNSGMLGGYGVLPNGFGFPGAFASGSALSGLSPTAQMSLAAQFGSPLAGPMGMGQFGVYNSPFANLASMNPVAAMAAGAMPAGGFGPFALNGLANVAGYNGPIMPFGGNAANSGPWPNSPLGFGYISGHGWSPLDNSGPRGGWGYGSWNPNAMPGQMNNTNPTYETQHQAEVARLLADPALTVEDKVTLMIMLIMKKMDDDILKQAEYINSIQQQQSSRTPGEPGIGGTFTGPTAPAGAFGGGTASGAGGAFAGGNGTPGESSPSIDVETLKLKRMVDKRSQMFDMLRQIIDKYNQTAKGIIDTIGR